MNRRILYIDDKEANLLAFKALLRRDFEIFTCSDPLEALEMVEREDIALVVADYKMPIMTGVAFLEQVRIRFPHTVRILLSGHADINAVIESVNKGEVFRFIKKPWIEELLINEISNAFELYDTKQNLEFKNQELERAYRELSYFTYSAAHNLTGPVATVQGLIGLMREEPEKQTEYIEYIEQTLHVLNNHLRNIISFNQNKLEKLEVESVELSVFISDMLTEFRYYPGFDTLDVEVAVQQKGTFLSDLSRLNLIFSNLIINCIKYRDVHKSTHLLSIRCTCEEGYMMTRIRDNGIGIEKENLDKVKEIFFREATDRLGSGLGLFIVNETIEKMGGNMRIDSEKGHYTEFVISLPSMSDDEAP